MKRRAPATEASDYRLYTSLDRPSNDKKRAEIDLGALRQNYRILREELRRRAPAVRMIAVVKADAYGHGAPACVRALLREGCDFFAVSCLEEAIPVRHACEACGSEAEILILGYTDPDEAETLQRLRLTQALLSLDYALQLERQASLFGGRVRAHVAVNTGMNRIGFDARNAEEIEAAAAAIARLRCSDALDLTGMFTHFSKADEASAEGIAYTALQSDRYCALRRALEARGCDIPFHHACNSAAAVRGAVPPMDGVRLGILLYGGQPALCPALPLRSVMRLKAEVVHLFDLLPGESVGYGGTFCATSARRIAVLPIGYADGFLRAYSGAEVLLSSEDGMHLAPIVGRICMDQCMLDVTGWQVHVGDTATLFGEMSVPLPRLSERANTIDYESLCLVSARVPRVYSDASAD